MEEDINSARASIRTPIDSTSRSDDADAPLSRWLAGVQRELENLRARNQYRSLKPHTGRLDFSSNDYLSLNASGRMAQFLREIVSDGAQVSGGRAAAMIGSTGSRLIRGHYDAFERAEEDFARYTETKSALLFHSGYAANTGALPVVIAPRDTVFCDRLCHASLLDGIRLSGARRYYFRHNDLQDLETQLGKYAGGAGNRIWIVTEAVFSMDGDSPDLKALCDIAERFDACVYLDEAHSIGVTGPRGAGVAAAQGVTDRIAVNVFPCGKAPGLMGAFVCGEPELKELLVNRARSFIFTTAQPPHLAHLLSVVIAWLQSEEADVARAHVQELARNLRTRLDSRGLDTGASTTHIVPVITGSETSALDLAERCQRAGLDVRAIRPPTVPKGSSRLRVILQAGHSVQDLEELLEVLLPSEI